jgi:hypothetical protein
MARLNLISDDVYKLNANINHVTGKIMINAVKLFTFYNKKPPEENILYFESSDEIVYFELTPGKWLTENMIKEALTYNYETILLITIELYILHYWTPPNRTTMYLDLPIGEWLYYKIANEYDKLGQQLTDLLNEYNFVFFPLWVANGYNILLSIVELCDFYKLPANKLYDYLMDNVAIIATDLRPYLNTMNSSSYKKYINYLAQNYKTILPILGQ